MINLTRLNGGEFTLNSDLIEIMEETPDTVITLTTGHKYIVKESVDTIVSRIKAFKKDVYIKVVRKED